jgi:hypothetical protein
MRMQPLDLPHTIASQDRRRRRARVFLAVSAVVALALIERPTQPHPGASGELYSVFRMSERWSPRGDAVVLRYRTDAATRSEAAAEAADLLPRAIERAEATGLRRVIVQANAPVVRVGRGAGVYREWRFRFAERDGSWLPELASGASGI